MCRYDGSLLGVLRYAEAILNLPDLVTSSPKLLSPVRAKNLGQVQEGVAGHWEKYLEK